MDNKMILKTNTRYLLNKKSTLTNKKLVQLRPEEHFILEISNTGNFFKSRTPDNKIEWQSVDQYDILEELSNMKE